MRRRYSAYLYDMEFFFQLDVLVNLNFKKKDLMQAYEQSIMKAWQLTYAQEISVNAQTNIP